MMQTKNWIDLNDRCYQTKGTDTTNQTYKEFRYVAQLARALKETLRESEPSGDDL